MKSAKCRVLKYPIKRQLDFEQVEGSPNCCITCYIFRPNFVTASLSLHLSSFLSLSLFLYVKKLFWSSAICRFKTFYKSNWPISSLSRWHNVKQVQSHSHLYTLSILVFNIYLWNLYIHIFFKWNKKIIIRNKESLMQRSKNCNWKQTHQLTINSKERGRFFRWGLVGPPVGRTKPSPIIFSNFFFRKKNFFTRSSFTKEVRERGEDVKKIFQKKEKKKNRFSSRSNFCNEFFGEFF